jgi:hypothetical protein
MMNTESNLANEVSRVLRAKGSKSVKSLYWNADKGNLSVFASGYITGNGKSFNYTPDPEATFDEIADYVAKRCEELNGE